MNWLIRYLFDYTGPVKFSSEQGVEETLRSIRKLIDNPRYDKEETAAFRSYLSGRVSVQEVVIHRARPLIGNYFSKPIFYGNLVDHNGTVTLEGVFTTSRLTKGLFLIAYVLLFILELVFVVSAIRSEGPFLGKLMLVLFLPIVGSLVAGAHLFLTRVFRGDVEWIGRAITDALAMH